MQKHLTWLQVYASNCMLYRSFKSPWVAQGSIQKSEASETSTAGMDMVWFGCA
jgi:hypothetical protein